MPTLLSESKNVERTLWTADEFLDWLQPKIYADLIDGEKFMHSPVNFRHATLLNFFHGLLYSFAEERGLGAVHREVVAVRLSSRNVFMPDVSYFTTEQVRRLAPAHAPFAPTFVAEALSPHTAERDIGPKFAAYEEHGVQEYWVLDPQTLAHRFYAREGEFLVEFGAGEERIAARSIPGFWVKRAWLDPENHPPGAAALREVLG